MLHELVWFSKRAVLIIGALLAVLIVLAIAHLSQSEMMVLSLVAFILAHLWLLLWLSIKFQLMHHHGRLVSVQIRWRESNRLLLHFPLPR